MSLEGLGNLNLNVNVSIFAPVKSGPSVSPNIYKGRIYNRELDQSVVIELEAEEGSDYLSPGRPILLFLAHDLGLYIFSTTVSSKNSSDGITFLHCSNPQQIRYFQRRKSVRVNVSIPISFSAEFDRSKVWDGSIRNISIGGLQLETPFEIPVGTTLELFYQLEDVGPIFMDGIVKRVTATESSYVYGLQFSNADPHCIDGIARFIMAEQMRQKRLGLQIFKAFILKSTVETQAPAIFSIIQFKNIDISALQGKKCSGVITEIGLSDLRLECPLKLPVGAVLEFSFELPKLGYCTLKAQTTEVTMQNGKFLALAAYSPEYENIRDCILNQLAEDFSITFMDV